ncbi:diacylglycerol/lipid kinase family protein [Parapedobacter tibetensis]|uniref:diacylglycerol/lipid kinase family protein n=1 Tax=Parapedobacter tibetensis TaxID=2972951 RepID=UPI00214D9E68|nr:diacylglycerol kinase family protein [Parapedobacter tibetensis]
MKPGAHVYVLHNPNAGDQNNTKKDLVNLIESAGFPCKYASVKEKGWLRFKKNTAVLVVVGGDGTIRQVIKEILDRRLLDKRLPIVLLPRGTANNFAKTLQLSPKLLDLPLRIHHGQVKKIDVGFISNIPELSFFLEGLGFGLLPALIKAMRESNLSAAKVNGQELDMAFAKLMQITQHHKAEHAKLIVDGRTYEGNFLLIEILNIKSIGPNLELAPDADPSDGKFHVALLKEEMRQAFLVYLQNKKNVSSKKITPVVPWELIEVTDEVTVVSENRLLHADDELMYLNKKKRIKVEVRTGVLDVVL